MLNVSSAERDITGRAAIRDAALRLFAEHGPRATSMRAIAQEAGVSAALVVHHFGSKEGLKQAVDAHVDAAFEQFFDLERPEDVAAMLTDDSAASLAEAFVRAFPDDSPLPAYLRRLLLSGDPAATRIFGRWHRSTVMLLSTLEQMGIAKPSDDRITRAAFALTADLGMVLLREPLRDALGYDPLTKRGLQRYAHEVQAIYAEGMWMAPPDGAGGGAEPRTEQTDE